MIVGKPLKEKLMAKLTEPTKAQIKEFLEQCGFKFTPHLSSKGNTYKTTEIMGYPDGFRHIVYKGESPPIDLNNLFKWAVPLALIKIGTVMFENMSVERARGVLFRLWLRKLDEGMSDEDALFWTIWEVIHNESN